MLGSRTRIVLLTSFFVFAFALSFLALLQNYVHAEAPLSSPSVRAISVKATSMAYQVVPDYWLDTHQAPWFDYDSDDSFQKFLHDTHPFNDSSYTPTDLVPIDSNFTANTSKKFQLRSEAALAFADMAWHFRNTFSWDRLYLSSAYRSRGLQDYLIKQWCSLIKCAQIGTSEHQAWLAVDIKVIAKWGRAYSLDAAYPNKYSDRLKINAARFGFHNTYQKWVDVDGKIAEWWHRRYVWVELATLLAENDQTFTEYYFNTINNE